MSSPDLNEDDRRSVLEVLETRYLSIGPKLEAFEDAVKKYCGARQAVGVCSGTAGLHLCVRAAGINPGDFVITTPFSFISSANVILFENAVPIFVDVDPTTGNIDPKLVKKAAADISSSKTDRMSQWLPRKGASISGKLRAILPVDVFGQPVDYDELKKTADTFSLTIIEDSCEALGSEYKGKKAGRLGDFGVYAFYPNKQITTAEGGMIVTDNSEAAELMRSLRNQGRAPEDTWLQHTYLGYNYRLDEMSAALGLSQIQRLDELVEKRDRVAKLYNERLQGILEIETPHIAPPTTTISWFVYVVRVMNGISRDRLADCLEKEGIPVRPYFLPIHLQPYMVERFGYQPGDFLVTEDLGRRSLALPFSGLMTAEQVDLVCSKLEVCIRKAIV